MLHALQHPNIVRFYGMYHTDDVAQAIVMEKMATTLERYYRSTNIIPIDAVLIFCDICAGLAHIHANGIIHRDLTTLNVLLSNDTLPRAKIGDFSRARFSSSAEGEDEDQKMLTECPGTRLYMPPESKGVGAKYNEKLDSFSLGVLMMATLVRCEPPLSLLELPIAGKAEIERRKSDFRKLPNDNPVKEVIQRCLVNKPEERPSSADLHTDLVEIALQLGGHATTSEVSSAKANSFYVSLKLFMHQECMHAHLTSCCGARLTLYQRGLSPVFYQTSDFACHLHPVERTF